MALRGLLRAERSEPMQQKEKKNSIKLEFLVAKHDFSRAGEASSNIKKILRQLGVDSQTIRKVSIATYEAEMNIAIHSEGGKLTVWICPSHIKIIAEDKGPGIEDIDLAMQEGYSTAPNQVRELGFGAGMGLPNIKRYCDKFTIQSKKGEPTILDMLIYTNS